jgi:hypothetical protein
MIQRAAWSLTYYAASVASSTGSQIESPREPHDARWFWPDWSRSLSDPFIQSSMSNHGPVRARRYHAASVLKYISGITEPVNKSTIGYFKSVVRVSFRLPVHSESSLSHIWMVRHLITLRYIKNS